MKRAFTLLELIIVLVIIFSLIALAITQYTKIIERGCSAEAKSILGQIRLFEEVYKLEHYKYTDKLTNLPIEIPAECQSTHHFSYAITAADAKNFTAKATRCTSTGKQPNASLEYEITIDQDGNWGGTEGYY